MSKWQCEKCGYSDSFMSLNYCPKCGNPNWPCRLKDKNLIIELEDAPSIISFLCKTEGAVITAHPNMNSERLFVMGYGDLLPIFDQNDYYYQLIVPGGERGFIDKRAGTMVDIGLTQISHPLGYIRLAPSYSSTNVLSRQPDDQWAIVYTIRENEKLPVVKENEHYYCVQLPSRLRGWVAKLGLTRTLSEKSLPNSTDWGAVLGIAALGGLALVAGGIGAAMQSDNEED